MRYRVGVRSLLVLVAVLCFAGCGDAPKPARDPYIVDGQAFDPATGTLTVNISVPSNATEDWVKAAVQEVVDGRKQEYKVIWVRTYVRTSNENVPYAVSYYDASGLTHRFSGKSEERKIPTH